MPKCKTTQLNYSDGLPLRKYQIIDDKKVWLRGIQTSHMD